MLSVIPRSFVLYGGTALGLRLGHRVSVDFDFFTVSEFSVGELQSRFEFLSGGVATQDKRNKLAVSFRAGPGKASVSFFGGLDLREVEAPDVASDIGIAVASLLDLLGTKLKVLQQRGSSKDYVDIDALVQHGLTLEQGLGAARAIYGERLDLSLSVRALSFFDDGDVTSLPNEARQRLSLLARSVNLDAIASYPSRPFLGAEG
jgi:hypothetical protein